MSKTKLISPVNIALGVFVAMASCLGLVTLLARLVISERIGELGIEIATNIIVFLSVLIGGIISVVRSKSKQLICSILYAGIMVLILVITGLVTDGTFENGILRLGSVAIAGGLLCTKYIKSDKRQNMKNRRYR